MLTTEVNFLEDEPYGRFGFEFVVKHNGQLIFRETDMMEPEDVSFVRDLKWIPEIIKKVYNLGHSDGYKSSQEIMLRGIDYAMKKEKKHEN